MSLEFPENPEYELAIHARTPYLDDDVEGGYFGALDYVGEYAIVSGFRGPTMQVSGEFATLILRVGSKSVAEAMEGYDWRRKVLSEFGSNFPGKIREMHMMMKQSFAELANIVTEG